MTDKVKSKTVHSLTIRGTNPKKQRQERIAVIGTLGEAAFNVVAGSVSVAVFATVVFGLTFIALQLPTPILDAWGVPYTLDVMGILAGIVHMFLWTMLGAVAIPFCVGIYVVAGCRVYHWLRDALRDTR